MENPSDVLKKKLCQGCETPRDGEKTYLTANKGGGIAMQWEDDFEIGVEIQERCTVVSANRAGLLSLSHQLKALAEGTPGSHIHYDEFNALENGSDELIIVLTDA